MINHLVALLFFITRRLTIRPQWSAPRAGRRSTMRWRARPHLALVFIDRVTSEIEPRVSFHLQTLLQTARAPCGGWRRRRFWPGEQAAKQVHGRFMLRAVCSAACTASSIAASKTARLRSMLAVALTSSGRNRRSSAPRIRLRGWLVDALEVDTAQKSNRSLNGPLPVSQMALRALTDALDRTAVDDTTVIDR